MPAGARSGHLDASARRPRGRPRLALLLVAFALVGCGNEYTCPAPIGPIVRDDCSVYETRYEALQVELGVTFAGIGVGVGVGDTAIRDPGELIQVLKLQTMALCRDYNVCRLAPDDYRARRRALDDRYTAIAALNAQLRIADDTATRREVVGSLVELLRTPLEQPAVAAPKDDTRTSPFRNDTGMWVGGPHQGPMPTLPPSVPALAWWQPIEVRGVGPASTRVFLTFRGAAAADDFAYATLPDGTEARCVVRPFGPRDHDPQRSPGARASCDFPDVKRPPTTGRLTIDYRPGLTGARHRVAAVPLAPDVRAGEAWLAYLPSPVRREPIDHFRPWLVLFRPERRERNVTMRCTHEGRPVGGPIRARSAMRRLGDLTRYHLPLPISLPEPGRVAELPGDRVPATAAGRWSCRVSVTGKPVRTIDFRLDADGRPIVGRPADGFAPPWWPIAGHAARPAGGDP